MWRLLSNRVHTDGVEATVKVYSRGLKLLTLYIKMRKPLLDKLILRKGLLFYSHMPQDVLTVTGGVAG